MKISNMKDFIKGHSSPTGSHHKVILIHQNMGKGHFKFKVHFCDMCHLLGHCSSFC